MQLPEEQIKVIENNKRIKTRPKHRSNYYVNDEVNDMFIAVTDLSPLANQCSRQTIRPHTDQSATSRICTLHQGWVTVSRIIVCTSPTNRYQRRISVSSCGGLFPEKRHSTYKHHLMCYRWRPVHGWSPPWISKLFEKSCSESPHSSLCDRSIDNT